VLSQVGDVDELGQGPRRGDGRIDVPEAKVRGVGEVGIEPLDVLAGVLLDGEDQEEDAVVLAGASAGLERDGNAGGEHGREAALGRSETDEGAAEGARGRGADRRARIGADPGARVRREEEVCGDEEHGLGRTAQEAIVAGGELEGGEVETKAEGAHAFPRQRRGSG
jgi:hypothetical protein